MTRCIFCGGDNDHGGTCMSCGIGRIDQMREEVRRWDLEHGQRAAKLTNEQIGAAATAIANARCGRRGMPPISNILDALPEKLREEAFDDARAALWAFLEV